MAQAPILHIDPFDEAFLSDPYSHHDTIREAGPVVWLDQVQAYAMARYDEVRDSLRDHEVFCSGRGVGVADFAKEEPWRPPSLLLEADPPLHSRTRGIMNKVASIAALRELRPQWTAKADALIDRLVIKRRFDAVKDLSEVYPMEIFPDAIGIRPDGREHLLAYATTVFNGFGPRNAVAARAEASAAGAMEWVTQACKRENLKAGGWGMAVYAAADRGECSSQEAERLVRSFLSAGVDTTVNGIGHLLLACTEFPDEWDRLRADPALVKKAFDESLRWDSTVQTFFRTTTRSVEVAGIDIPEGSKVIFFMAAANRDPRKWEQPERFRLDRSASGHVGFGFGIHQCLGQMVARLEGELILRSLLDRVKSIRATGAPVRRLNNTLHALESLPVEVDPI